MLSLRLKDEGMLEDNVDVGEDDEGDGLKEKSVNTVVLRERSARDSWVWITSTVSMDMSMI